MTYYKKIDEIIGNTPLIEITNYNETHKLAATIMGKLESRNPAGSIKDRVALSLIDTAESDGLITADTVIIEPTSGNTGVGLAAIAATRNYRLILTMPDTMSQERRDLLHAFGAELVLTEGAKGLQGAVDKAAELASEIPNSFITGQFVNPANTAAHFATTGPEIWQDTNGNVDIFVSAVGTGGTLTGTGRYLKNQNPDLYIVAVEPAASPVLSEGRAGTHKIQGIGAGFVPEVLDTQIYDEVITVEDADAYETARMLARTDGLLIGPSSGATLWAATQLAEREENAGKNIVVIFPDSGERYLSLGLYTG